MQHVQPPSTGPSNYLLEIIMDGMRISSSILFRIAKARIRSALIPLRLLAFRGNPPRPSQVFELNESRSTSDSKRDFQVHGVTTANHGDFGAITKFRSIRLKLPSRSLI